MFSLRYILFPTFLILLPACYASNGPIGYDVMKDKWLNMMSDVMDAAYEKYPEHRGKLVKRMNEMVKAVREGLENGDEISIARRRRKQGGGFWGFLNNLGKIYTGPGGYRFQGSG